MDNKLSIAQWDEADRPREKLAKNGAASLSNAELLAILIGSGTPNEDAVKLMQRILADNDNSLNKLGKRNISELCEYNGIGPAKAITVIAACELGKRRAAEPVEEREKLLSSQDIYRYYLQKMKDLPYEEIHVALLNNRLQLLSSRIVGRGGITETTADIRLILKEALMAGASAMALCHNHPSGTPQPSQQDNRLTEQLKKAAEVMNVRLIDHVIVSDGNYYSYHDEGKI